MIHRLAILLTVVGLLSSCGGAGREAEEAKGTLCDPSEPLPSPSPSFGPARALIDTEEGSVLVDLVIAETDEQQQYGLMHRDSFPEDCGMAFLYFEEHSGGFWMKNTRIPLSIAFFDDEGEILAILDMEPCEKDPCEVYDPGVAYIGALEVNQGRFEDWGVRVGDQFSITR
ncbi:MAG TPA: DUF192 domain-containing protein [Actinomycetota bacterium]|nr:DUF192 domain-containing protein [Actinomycetota bacterium]